jgi:hypothetical protein
MFKLIIGLFVVVMLSFPVFAQESQEADDNLFFAGYRYDEGPIASFGYGRNISGGLWTFQYADWGNYQTWNSEVAYLFFPDFLNNKVFVGPIAGPDTDWLNTAEDDDLETIVYLNGAAGAIAGTHFSGDWGIWGYGKYKFALEDNLYIDGWHCGVGFYYSF